jgi:hypothetical protein
MSIDVHWTHSAQRLVEALLNNVMEDGGLDGVRRLLKGTSFETMDDKELASVVSTALIRDHPA